MPQYSIHNLSLDNHTNVWYYWLILKMKYNYKLTEKQKRVLDFIWQKTRQDMPPTIREIASHMGFSSTGTVRDYLDVLEKKGYLKRRNKLSRAINLSRSLASIPILANIPAGNPNLAYEDIQGHIDPDDLFLGRVSFDDVFALKVDGESMRDAGILEGDIVIIRKQATANNGDIVAALLENNEVTLKRLKYKGKRPYLEPANKDYVPIQDKFTILGKVITVLRKYP
jgi:repressor LexA